MNDKKMNQLKVVGPNLIDLKMKGPKVYKNLEWGTKVRKS